MTFVFNYRVLFPGGATYFNQSNGYADAGEHIMAIAKEMNDAGDYFPLFGTCLGFELFIILESGRGYPENRIRCYSYDNLPLTFTEGNFVCFYILRYSISSGELLYFLFFLFHFNTYLLLLISM